MRMRKRTFAEFVALFIIDALLTALAGWLFMLAVGVVHHEWIPQCPTIGFTWSVVLVALLRGAFRISSPSDDDR